MIKREHIALSGCPVEDIYIYIEREREIEMKKASKNEINTFPAQRWNVRVHIYSDDMPCCAIKKRLLEREDYIYLKVAVRGSFFNNENSPKCEPSVCRPTI